jgi:hypothetical protein
MITTTKASSLLEFFGANLQQQSILHLDYKLTTKDLLGLLLLHVKQRSEIA